MNKQSESKWEKRAICIEDGCMVPRDRAELAILEWDKPGCEANIGRLVAVVGEEQETEDRDWVVPLRPMDERPWATIGEGGEVVYVEGQTIWRSVCDVMSTRCFAPMSTVPGMGEPTGTEFVTDGSFDEYRVRCQPGDTVLVVDAPFHPYPFLAADEKVQIGRIGVVLGHEVASPDGYGWLWAVAKADGSCWTNTYSVGGEAYTVDEPVMLINDARLLPLMAGNTPYNLEEE